MDLTYIETVLADKPVAYWPLMETQGTTAYDWSGYGNHGTIQGGVTLGQTTAPGLPGTAMGFDGSTGFIQTPWAQNAVTLYSLEAWVQLPPLSSSASLPLICDRGSGAGLSLTLAAPGVANSNADGVGFGVDSNGIFVGINSTQTVADNTWHHVVGTWAAPSGTAVSPAQFAIWIDGQSTAVTNTTVGSATSPLTGLGGTTLMYSAPWGYRAGVLAHVAIYLSVLTPAQIQRHFFARPRSLLT